MADPNPSDEEVRRILVEARTIAVVGASSKIDRPSHGVMQMLISAGYDVVPINPREVEVLGARAYGSLAEVPRRIDLVDVFRRAEETPAIAREAVRAGARTLWLQSGIVSEEAARIAREGGLAVVMDACIAVQHSLLRVPRRR